MCGIVGVLGVSPGSSIGPAVLRRMCKEVAHRGPDDEGFFLDGSVGLGHRRLSIIDLETGKQPMSTQDGRYTIVFNGEIFNYRELRSELARGGATFRTHSDTEVILQGFARAGAGFLDRLDGMFAFLLWDAHTRTLLAARDPFGIKPLYVLRSGARILLASEIRALRAEVPGSWQLRADALETYLDLGYVAGRDTLFEGVSRVTPGCLLTIRADGAMREESFCRRVHPLALQDGRPETSLTDLRRTLASAVERSLVADVPVGLYLSGGIDSSLIAAITVRELGRKLESFSVRFGDQPDFDEGAHAQRVADLLGLEHRFIQATPGDFRDLRGLVRTLEEPMADPSAVALGCLSGLASGRVKVVLSGEGGDELFGGYHRYFWDRLVERYRRIPRPLRKAVEGAAGRVGSGRFRRRTAKIRETAGLDRSARYAAWFSPFTGTERSSLLFRKPTSATHRLFSRVLHEAEPLSETAQLQWLDMNTFLCDDLLVKADKMSMHHSIEVRVPFLQADVVQAAFSLADNRRGGGRWTKPALRQLLGEYLPSEIAHRAKQGFEVPIGRWLSGPLRPVLEEHLSEERVRGEELFQWPAVRLIREEHLSGKRDRGLALFALMLAQAWSEEFRRK